MSEAKKDGGPAFPARPNWWDPDDMAYKEGDFQKGMTLRDYFAAKAMQAAMSRSLPTKGHEMYELSVDCYRMADAMLKARQE